VLGLTSSYGFVITATPGLTVTEGDAVTLAIDTADALTYQWQTDSLDDGTFEDIAGATDSSLAIASAALADSGDFRCLVSADGGTSYDTSDVATLQVSASTTSYADWTYKATFMVGTTPDWANLASGSVANFPFVLRLDSSHFDFSQAMGNGEDIRFSTVDETSLNYEIELWDSTGGQAIIWILIDSINANEEQALVMYWGNSGQTSESDGAAVFTTANGFAGVYHMSEDPAGGAGSIIDHGQTAFDGTPLGSMDAADVVDCVVGSCLDFDGADDGIDLGDQTTSFSSGVTMCGWVNFREMVPWTRVVDCAAG
jgi:hypothetical protein